MKHGEVSVCIHCSGVSSIVINCDDDTISLRKTTVEDFEKIDDETCAIIMNLVNRVIARNKAKNQDRSNLN